jgi:glycerophosphoryl diester phosphodiesterase
MTIIGHRGGVSKNGENTLDVFQQGFLDGADIIECDLNITKDNIIFIYHDSFIKSSGGKKYTKDISYGELLSIKPTICSLDNLLENLGDKLFIFELKSESDYKKIIDIFSSQHEKEFLKNRFISFSMDALKYVKSKNKDVFCSYIGTSAGNDKRIEPFITKKHIDLCVQNSIEELSGHWLTFASKNIKKSHEKGLRVGLGPINSKMAYNYCVENEVDSVYTDDVIKIRRFIDSLNK